MIKSVVNKKELALKLPLWANAKIESMKCKNSAQELNIREAK